MPKTKLLKKRNFLVNVFLLIFVVILFFVFMEIILRIISPSPKYDRGNEFVFYEYSEILGWKNKPGASGIFYIPDSESYVQINSKGLRDEEHEYEKKEETKRIEFYGDSFTWGYGVNEEDRFADIFGEELNSFSDKDYEIINLGTTGYGTDQQYLLLREEGLKYNPDVVVFVYHNDVGDVGRKTAYSYPKPFFIIENDELKLTNVPVPIRGGNWTEIPETEDSKNFVFKLDSSLRFFKTYDFLRTKLIYLKIFEKFRGSVIDIDTQETLSVIEKIILESRNLCNKNDVSFVVILIPDKSQVFGHANTIEIDTLDDFLEKNSISKINLLPELKQISKNEKDIYFDIDGHFSENGNRIVGELLLRKFTQEKILNVSEIIFLN